SRVEGLALLEGGQQGGPRRRRCARISSCCGRLGGGGTRTCELGGEFLVDAGQHLRERARVPRKASQIFVMARTVAPALAHPVFEPNELDRELLGGSQLRKASPILLQPGSQLARLRAARGTGCAPAILQVDLNQLFQ